MAAIARMQCLPTWQKFGKLHARIPVMAAYQRNTTTDHAHSMIGKREIVGYGINGSPNYCDKEDFPFPAIRFREADGVCCALRKRECEDWKKMSVDEIKTLYRYSFCQTFREFQAPTAEWKAALAIGLMFTCVTLWYVTAYYFFLYGELPETFSEERLQAQLKRIICLEMNPVRGLCSHWDYDNNKWK